MANSSFFKNTGTSTQIQGSANASAAAALASEQAALVSKNAAATSETNAAASAAAALVSKNAAATSAASANSDASAASISSTASQTAATTSSANVALTSADATQTAADRVQTGLDRVATNSDAVQTAADRVQTGLDVTSSGASAAAALSSRNAAATSETNAAASAASSSADATATASDRVQTGLDAASTAADAIATAADRVQTGLDATASANSASAASTSATAAAASQVSAASSAASAAAVFNDFEDRYYGPHASDSAAQTYIVGQGLTVDQGDLYFNSTANEMRVYDGGSWIAASSAGGASLINYHFTATAAQTAFTGADDNSNTLSYTVDNLIVTRNGVVLEDGTDYTATSGTSIALAVAAAAGDEINVVAFKSFTTADMVSATNGGAFQGNVDFAAGIDVTGNVTVTGTVDGRDVATDGTKLDGIEAGATADQTGAEIKASYEAEANTNAYTDAEKTKLTGIEASADVTDDTNVRAAGAVMTTGVSTLADSAYFKGAPTHGFRFNNNTDAYNNFIIRENGDTYTRGNAGIGTASPHSGSKLHILAAGTTQLRLDSSGAATGDGSFIRFMKGGTDIAYIGVAGTIMGSTSNDTMFYGNGANNMRFSTNGVERLRIKSNGQIYAAAESQSIATFGARKSGAAIEFGHLNNGGGYYGTLGSYGGGGQPYIGFCADAEDSVNTFTTRGFKGNLIVGHSDGSLSFSQLTNASATGQTPTPRMQIDPSGALLVNTTVRTGTSNFVVSADTNVANPMSVVNTKTGVGGEYGILFYRAGSIVGSIQTSLSATSYLTSSDYRLKTAVNYDWDATSRLKQLKPARFKWIADGDDAVFVDGFLAHECEAVPEAVTGEKDAMRDEEYEVTPAVLDDDDNEVTPAVMGTRSVPEYQSIDQSKLTPLLTKALIEAVEKIEQLEARITALETN